MKRCFILPSAAKGYAKPLQASAMKRSFTLPSAAKGYAKLQKPFGFAKSVLQKYFAPHRFNAL